MTEAPHRVANVGRVDRRRPIRFTFNGKDYTGFSGDTLASALLAHGVRLVGRSFKYHRPRGILSAGSEEPNALVQVALGAHTEPNLRAPTVELYDGLVASSVNCWPSVEFDLGSINSILSKIFVAGFYYKTFMAPKSFWMSLYEPIIRRAAGLGKAPTERDPDIYDHMHLSCDVLVAGGGPAGLMAALAAGRAGARVVLADERPEFGGALLDGAEEIEGQPAARWVSAVLAELATMPEVTLLPRTTVTAYHDHNYFVLAERRTDHLPIEKRAGKPRQRLWKLRAKQVVLATGAHERPLVFGDNDRPGVMLASAARAYLNRYGVLAGRRVVVATNNDSAYATALEMAAAGATIAAIVDARADTTGTLPARAKAAGLPIVMGSVVTGAVGGKRLDGVEIMALSGDGAGVKGYAKTLACDLVAMSGGWNPTVHLFSQSAGKLRFDEAAGCFVPGISVQAERSAGACRGVFDLAGCLRDGAQAGAEAARAAGFEAEPPAAPATEAILQSALRPLWLVPSSQPPGHGKQKHFVDFQNDVTAADIALAAREGYVSVEHLKRYTTMGMGTDQGKTSNVNALAIMAGILGQPIPGVGTTTFRPPYTPVSYGVLAGRDVEHLSDPVRTTPMHAWHVAQGAVFEDVGQWKRARHYPRGAETMDEAVHRECLAVRNAVGLFDASTLGKIDIQGPDASVLLNRIYTNAWSKLEIGACRYGLMCREDGMVFDDGVTTRLGPNHYVMTTTTGNAAPVMEWLEEWLQTEWPDLKVYLTSVTEHWATAAIAGPKAREVLAPLTDIDLSPDAFPFMTMREGLVAGVPARVMRISFSGELAYEVNVTSPGALPVWEALWASGQKHGITPYGTEAMHVLRAEKGYIIVGQETDGTVTPQDLGLGGMVSKQKDFVGKRSHARSDTSGEGRKQLVGLLPVDPNLVVPEGAAIVDHAMTAMPAPGSPPVPMLGHVTSSYLSPTLGRSFALAMVRDGRARQGGMVHVAVGGRTIACSVTSPVMYDTKGARLHA